MESKKAVNSKIAKILPHADGFARNEVLQLLRDNDYDTERTISDFEEGRAADLLEKWIPAGGKSSKRKNKGNKNKEVNQNEGNQATKQPVVNGVISESENHQKPVKNHQKPVKNQHKPDASRAINNDENDNVVNDPHTASVVLKHMLTNQVSNKTAANARPNLTDSSQAKDKIVPNATTNKDLKVQDQEGDKKLTVQSSEASRKRTISESNSKAKGNQRNRKGQRNAPANSDKQKPDETDQMRINAMHNRKSIEKAVRDLQRCSVSFGRYRTLLNEEFDESYKKLKQVFEELQSEVMDREILLMRTLDNRKEDALALLSKRETRAAQLKRMTDRVDGMSPQEVYNLRNDVKHFVSERKFEEELGKSVRFHCEKDNVMNAIKNMGELAAVKNLSVGHHRERYESTASDVSSIPPLAEHPPQSSSSAQHQTSPLAKRAPNQAPSAQKGSAAPQKNSPASHRSNPAPQKDTADQQRDAPPQRNTPAPQKNIPAPQKHTPAPKKSAPAPEQVVSVPQRSTSWADSVETRPLSENRASWAVDTPLVSSNHLKADEETSNNSNPGRNRNKPYFRRKNEKTNASNPPDKNQFAASTQNENLPREVPKSPGKAAGDANFQTKRGEPRSGEGAGRPREYDNRYRNFPPRGRAVFRGAPRGGYYPRGGYRNDRPRFQNMNSRGGENNRYPPRNNPRKNEDFSQTPTKSESASIPPTQDSNPAPPKSPRREKDTNSSPNNPKKEESIPLPPRNNQRNRRSRQFQTKNESNDENKPQDSPKMTNPQQSDATKTSDNKGLYKQE